MKYKNVSTNGLTEKVGAFLTIIREIAQINTDVCTHYHYKLTPGW